MAKETARKTRVIINDLHQGNHIDTMTKKWLLQTPDPPRIPVFYTLTKDIEKRKIKNNRNHTRRSNRRREKRIYNDKINQNYIKNLSNCEMTTDQINLLSKGLKFIPTPTVKENAVRKELLLDFKQFARRMRL